MRALLSSWRRRSSPLALSNDIVVVNSGRNSESVYFFDLRIRHNNGGDSKNVSSSESDVGAPSAFAFVPIAAASDRKECARALIEHLQQQKVRTIVGLTDEGKLFMISICGFF